MFCKLKLLVFDNSSSNERKRETILTTAQSNFALILIAHSLQAGWTLL